MDKPRLTHVRVNDRDLDNRRPIQLRGDNVDYWWQLVSPQSDVLEPLFDTPYGTRKFTIRDPDGNELGFVQS